MKIKKLTNDATIPTKGSVGSAGYDLYSSESGVIPPYSQLLVYMNIALELPENHYGQLKSRSGLALKHNIHVQAGVIDSDYCGEIKIILSNESSIPFDISKNAKIAQLLELGEASPSVLGFILSVKERKKEREVRLLLMEVLL